MVKTRSGCLIPARPGRGGMSETGARWSPPPEPLYVVAVLAPWALFSLLLPPGHRATALLLLALLGLLLAAAGAWARAHAERRGLDGAAWSFAAVASLGFSNGAMLLWDPRPGETLPAWLCHECGRAGALHEPFCLGCGAHP